MSRIFDAYRAVHEQGFLPIFIQDDYSTEVLVDACANAGMKCIEYTLRRPDAAVMIPWIKRNYPDLILLVGSTLDDEKIVRKMRDKHPQLLTVTELCSIGVDGFVSMIGWSVDSIEKHSRDRLLIPTAMTVTEAFQQVAAGAHFIKIAGQDEALLRRLRAPPTFDYCPIMATGGLTVERILQVVDLGVVLIGSGFDLMLKGKPMDFSSREMTGVLKDHIKTTQEARDLKWPSLGAAKGKGNAEWLASLPHYHVF